MAQLVGALLARAEKLADLDEAEQFPRRHRSATTNLSSSRRFRQVVNQEDD
jgi:hypothetical protein